MLWPAQGFGSAHHPPLPLDINVTRPYESDSSWCVLLLDRVGASRVHDTMEFQRTPFPCVGRWVQCLSWYPPAVPSAAH